MEVSEVRQAKPQFVWRMSVVVRQAVLRE